jgi:hypothetical protein
MPAAQVLSGLSDGESFATSVKNPESTYVVRILQRVSKKYKAELPDHRITRSATHICRRLRGDLLRQQSADTTTDPQRTRPSISGTGRLARSRLRGR